MSFQYALRRVGDVVVLDLSGRLVFGEDTLRKLDDLVHEQMKQGFNYILINLQRLNVTDTGGLGARVFTKVSEHGGILRFCEAKGTVLDVLRATRLDTVLNADDDEATAIKALSEKHLGKTSAV